MVDVEWDSVAKDYFDSLGYHQCDCGTLGIEINKFQHSVVMYPNPSTNSTVTLSASEKIEFVSVVNELGQVVYSEDFESGKNSLIIRGDFLSKGLYIITARFVDKSIYVDRYLRLC